ncbi:hypothetical protein Ga0080559_TMP3365 [Salipiger profundus]|uniref:Uncharacterized protein n=1 Tax=Salipiger profundus TaxID=1229727 RepID=A0A1U7D7M7_9RHOB|nr:hypothetical protein Ga0080559_TMP3365 [Salipiger profundus]
MARTGLAGPSCPPCGVVREMPILWHLTSVIPADVGSSKQKCCKTKISNLAKREVAKKKGTRWLDCMTRASSSACGRESWGLLTNGD